MARCAYVAALGTDCEDLDGDCHPGRCAIALPSDLAVRVLDCDDASITVNPSAPERCGGDDEDCDGATDEGYTLGACEACGQPGDRLCDPVDDLAPTRCMPRAPLDEVCDGADNDCDGRADEGCRLSLPEGIQPSRVAVCDTETLLVSDRVGGLHRLRRDVEGAWLAEVVPTADRFADYPACEGDFAAWIASAPDSPTALTCGPGGDAEAAEDPQRAQSAASVCLRASIFSQSGDEDPNEITGLEQPGAPVVDGDTLRWHSLVDAAPVLKEADRGRPGIRTLFGGQALSDATREAGGRLALRAWSPGEAPQLIVRDLRPESAGDLDLAAPPGAPLPPALSARWLVQVRDTGALWAVDLSSLDPTGFQFTARPGPHQQPAVLDDQVYWLDGSEAALALRAFDLLTGAETTLAENLPADTRLSAGPGLLAWTSPATEPPALHLEPIGATAPEPEPMDGGVEDRGVEDGDVEDGGGADAGPTDGGLADLGLDDGSAADVSAPDAGADAAEGLDAGL
jgi:hypothetical protein